MKYGIRSYSFDFYKGSGVGVEVRSHKIGFFSRNRSRKTLTTSNHFLNYLMMYIQTTRVYIFETTLYAN